LATDVIADPLWLIPPAKIAALFGKVGRATKFTDKVVVPAVKAISESPTGQKAIAWAEDVAGKNRLADEQFDFNAGRATDQVEGQDIIDAVREGKKQYGEDFNALTDYVQARKRPVNEQVFYRGQMVPTDVSDIGKDKNIAKIQTTKDVLGMSDEAELAKYKKALDNYQTEKNNLRSAIDEINRTYDVDRLGELAKAKGRLTFIEGQMPFYNKLLMN
jgi:hypothetical protein